MPRKGTETLFSHYALRGLLMKPMPRKGTETLFSHYALRGLLMKPMPRKGTETLVISHVACLSIDETHAP